MSIYWFEIWCKPLKSKEPFGGYLGHSLTHNPKVGLSISKIIAGTKNMTGWPEWSFQQYNYCAGARPCRLPQKRAGQNTKTSKVVYPQFIEEIPPPPFTILGSTEQAGKILSVGYVFMRCSENIWSSGQCLVRTSAGRLCASGGQFSRQQQQQLLQHF